MALKVNKSELWSVAIDDRAGGAADKIEPLANAGANFEFVFARRTPENPGKGILFVAPIKGQKVVRTATDIGLTRSLEVAALRVEGGNRSGVTAKMMRALADAGISFRGFSAAALGTKFVGYLAFDNPADAARAAGLLRKVG